LVVLKHLRHDIPLDKISNVKAFFKPHEFIILKQSWQAFSGFPRPGWTALFAGNRYLIFQGTSRKINPINRANIGSQQRVVIPAEAVPPEAGQGSAGLWLPGCRIEPGLTKKNQGLKTVFNSIFSTEGGLP
jgi:hypothetical protein